MIERYRWYVLDAGICFMSLISILNNNGIRDDGAFLIGYRDSNECYVKYFWKEMIVATSLDNDGNPTSNKVVTFRFQDIKIYSYKNSILLRIHNPTRSIKALFKSIENAVGSDIFFKKIEILNDFIDFFLSKLSNYKVVGLKLVGSIKENSIVSRLEFVSKRGINVAEINLLDGLKYKTVSASYEVLVDNEKGTISYTSTGIIKLSKNISEYLLKIIENSEIFYHHQLF